MPELSTNSKSAEYQEVLFWLLLLGSWQFLASPGGKTGIIGAVSAATFLMYAWANLDDLRGLGLEHACWRSAKRANWVLAGMSGIVAGAVVFMIGTVSGQNMRLEANWKLIALQGTLGPVLEEVVFRGYVFAFLIWLFAWVDSHSGRSRLVVVVAAVFLLRLILYSPGPVGCSWRASLAQERCMAGSGGAQGRPRQR